MFRILFRLLSLFLLAFAVMYVVIDASRTISGSGLVYTTVQETMFQLMPERAASLLDAMSEAVPGFVNDVLLATLLKAPTFIPAAVLALLCYVLSRKIRRSIGRFSLD